MENFPSVNCSLCVVATVFSFPTAWLRTALPSRLITLLAWHFARHLFCVSGRLNFLHPRSSKPSYLTIVNFWLEMNFSLTLVLFMTAVVTDEPLSCTFWQHFFVVFRQALVGPFHDSSRDWWATELCSFEFLSRNTLAVVGNVLPFCIQTGERSWFRRWLALERLHQHGESGV